MITFKSYLLESREKQTLMFDAVVELFKNDYSESLTLLNSKNELFRGTKTVPDNMVLLNGAKNERTALPGGAVYNYYLDTNPKNQGWPRRLVSSICTSDLHKAANFGREFYIFPKNGTSLTTLMFRDIWHSPNKFFKTDVAAEQTMYDASEKIEHILNTKKMPPISKLKDEIIAKADESKNTIKALTGGKSKKLSAEHLNDPENCFYYPAMGAKLLSIEEYANIKIPEGGTEVWFEGPCIMIYKKEISKLTEKLKEENLI